MNESIKNISLQFSHSSYWIILLAIIGILFAVYAYRFTLPPIGKAKKITLIALRSLALTFLLLLLFNLIATVLFVRESTASNLVFIDNSSSLSRPDSIENISGIRKVINELQATDNLEFELFAFGENIIPLTWEEADSLKYDGNTTNFEQIFDFLESENRSIGSVLILSDGIINRGKNPQLRANELNFPIVTVVIGDTSKERDISISNVLNNEFIYAGEQAFLDVSAENNTGEKIKTIIELYEGNNLLKSNPVTLSALGITNIKLDYTPDTEGIKQLRIKLTPLRGEINTSNNAKRVTLTVMDNRTKITILAGTPGSDVTFIQNYLKTNEDIELSTYIEVNENKTLGIFNANKVQESDILFLIGFPSRNTSSNIISSVAGLLEEEKISCFLQVNKSTDLTKLNQLAPLMGISIRANSDNQGLFQPQIRETGTYSSLFAPKEIWNNLPPINIPDNMVTAFGNSITLLSINNLAKETEIPVMILNDQEIKSITFLGYNIWKWKLQYKDPSFFDSFFSNIADWLKTSGKNKLFDLKSDKKIYSAGETVSFSAYVYNELLTPLSGADISLTLTTGQGEEIIYLEEKSNGIYGIEIRDLPPGVIRYEGIVKYKSRDIYKEEGELLIDPTSLENLVSQANTLFLTSLSSATQGRNYYNSDTEALLEFLNNNPLLRVNQTSFQENIEPKNYFAILGVIILIFSLEWFLRKYFGMN